MYASDEECLELREAMNTLSFKRYHVRAASGQGIDKYIYLQIHLPSLTIDSRGQDHIILSALIKTTKKMFL